MRSTLLWPLMVVAVAYLAFCLYLYLAQRSLIYFPVPEAAAVAADDLRIRSGAQTLQVWRRASGQACAIVYFGGNAEDVSGNLPLFERLFPEYALYLVNYRGYGASTGAPSEAALYADALAVHAHVSAAHDHVAVIGRSLGSAVATFLAAQRPVERLVLVTAFDSLGHIARSAYPFVPVSLLLRDRYDSFSHARHVTAPTLLLIAGRDEFIPQRSSRALAAAVASPVVQVEVIDQAGHNTISDFPAYADALRRFFADRH